jgi:hypothetical protein
MASFKMQDGTEITLIPSNYHDGGRKAIKLMDGEEPYAMLTINIPEEPLEKGEFLVKGWSENEDVIEAARASGLFVDTGRRVPAGRCQAEVWILAPGVTL